MFFMLDLSREMRLGCLRNLFEAKGILFMNRFLFTIIMTLCFIFPVKAEDEFYTLPIVVPTPKTGEFKVHRDLVYLDTTEARTRADIFLPSGADKKHAAIIFVHGGPIPKDLPAAKDWQMFQSYGSLVTSAGLAGVVFNHRFNSLNPTFRSREFIKNKYCKRKITTRIVNRSQDNWSIDQNHQMIFLR